MARSGRSTRHRSGSVVSRVGGGASAREASPTPNDKSGPTLIKKGGAAVVCRSGRLVGFDVFDRHLRFFRLGHSVLVQIVEGLGAGLET